MTEDKLGLLLLNLSRSGHPCEEAVIYIRALDFPYRFLFFMYCPFFTKSLFSSFLSVCALRFSQMRKRFETEYGVQLMILTSSIVERNCTQ